MTGAGRASDPAAHFQTGGAACAAFRPGCPPQLSAALAETGWGGAARLTRRRAAPLTGLPVSAGAPEPDLRRYVDSAPGAAGPGPAILPMVARSAVRFPIALRAGRVA